MGNDKITIDEKYTGLTRREGGGFFYAGDISGGWVEILLDEPLLLTGKIEADHLVNIACDILCEEDILSGGVIISKGAIKALGDIKATGYIKADGDIKSGGKISGVNIVSGGHIVSDARISAEHWVDADGDIQARGSIEAEYHIFAGGNILTKMDIITDVLEAVGHIESGRYITARTSARAGGHIRCDAICAAMREPFDNTESEKRIVCSQFEGKVILGKLVLGGDAK